MRGVGVVEVVSIHLTNDEIGNGKHVTEEELAGAGEVLLGLLEECGQLLLEELVAQILLLDGILLLEDSGVNLGEDIGIVVDNPVVLELNLDVGRVVSVLSGEKSKNRHRLADHLAVVQGNLGKTTTAELGHLKSHPLILSDPIVDEVNLGVGEHHTDGLSSTIDVEVGKNDLLLLHGLSGRFTTHYFFSFEIKFII